MGITLAVISGSNFLGVAKFLQFLGLLVAVHGLPEAFQNFCKGFEKINLDLSAFDDILSGLLDKFMPFDYHNLGNAAAAEAGLPAEVGHKVNYLGMDVGGNMQEMAKIAKEYKEQFVQFREEMYQFRKDFAAQRNLLLQVLVVPLLLLLAVLAFMLRAALRFQGGRTARMLGKDYD
ncbi:unnamed protein product, partial [Amoebophrya sp. A120]|eukprot:GSA120T00002639001.1